MNSLFEAEFDKIAKEKDLGWRLRDFFKRNQISPLSHSIGDEDFSRLGGIISQLENKHKDDPYFKDLKNEYENSKTTRNLLD